MSKRTFSNTNISDTVISRDIQIKGDLTSDNDIWVDGYIEGNVSTHGNLTIGVNGNIIGDTEGYEIRIAGRVDGNITARGAIICDDTAAVNGKLSSGDLVVARGATINGEVTVINGETAPDQEE